MPRKEKERRVKIVIRIEDKNLEPFTFAVDCRFNGKKLERVRGTLRDVEEHELPDIIRK